MKFNLNCDKGNWKIVFTLQGKRHHLYPGTKDENTARQIVKQMEYELLNGSFDHTLQRYKLRNRVEKKIVSDRPVKLIDLYDRYLDSLELEESVRARHWETLRRIILKHSPSVQDVKWFQAYKERWSSSTYNNRKNRLKGCYQWGINKGLVDENPYFELKPKREERTEVKALTEDEVKAILNYFSDSHYLPFIKFLFLTGVRLGEAIGLTWNCVDFKERKITIKQAVGLDYSGSKQRARRVLKKTKTGSARTIPMGDSLYTLLFSIQKNHKLVFPPSQGSFMDTNHFRDKHWKPALEALDIDPSKLPKVSRHTVLSHLIKETGDLAMAAKLAGHTDLTMVSKHYGKLVQEIVIPDLTK